MKYKRIFLNLTEFTVQNAVGRLGGGGGQGPRAPRNVNLALATVYSNLQQVHFIKVNKCSKINKYVLCNI